MSFQAEAVVDVSAISANVAGLVAASRTQVLAPVKANGYGHGLVPAAFACLDGGAAWLGVATLDEALTLRRAGVKAPVLAWLVGPGQDLASAAEHDIELSAMSFKQLEENAATKARHRPRVQLEADTGMGRGGVPPTLWPGFAELAHKLQSQGRIEVTGAWSHMACADEPEHPANAKQRESFTQFLDVLSSAGLSVRWRHLANSAATLTDPRTHYDLVRPGIAIYGYPPVSTTVKLTPAMTLRTRLAMVKTLPPNHGVSYGHTFVTPHPTRVGVAPLGYADGIARAVSNVAKVVVKDKICPIRGRVCMDQTMIDLTDVDASTGDVVEFFGNTPVTAQDWARWNDTISYEILVTVGSRVPRRYVKAAE